MLCDSCSLPILIRSFANLSATHHVDGGLCDNLPVEVLIEQGQDVIFAIFPKVEADNRKITNILAYISSLLSASIGHSVTRSVSLVAKPFRFEAETHLGLLDFKEAIAQLANLDWYENEKDKALRRIRDFSISYGGGASHLASASDRRSWYRAISGGYVRTSGNESAATDLSVGNVFSPS